MQTQPNSTYHENKPGTVSTAARIRELNDAFRQQLRGGHLMLTRGISELGAETVERAIRSVRDFSDFGPGIDPYREHDFGAFDCAGERIFWKIDSYDKSLEFGSPDPAEPLVTTRVLTIMLAAEY